jgi:hypothetical protein
MLKTPQRPRANPAVTPQEARRERGDVARAKQEAKKPWNKAKIGHGVADS